MLQSRPMIRKAVLGAILFFRESGIPIKKTVAYKLSRIEGCLSFNETFSEWTAGQVSFDQKRQHKCSPVYQSSVGTRSPNLCFLTLEFWKLAIENNIILEAAHIIENKNFSADQLSRIKSVQQNKHWTSMMWGWFLKFLGNPVIDQFASAENKQTEIYCTCTPNPNSLALDAMTISWENMFAYVFLLIVWFRGYFNIWCNSVARLF